MTSMRTKYLSTIALLCALVYVLSLGIAAYRLGKTASDRKATAGHEFTDLVDRASSAAVLGFMDEPFRETVRDSVRSSHSLAAVIVTGPNGPEYAVEREPGYLVRLADEPRFAARIDASRSPLFAPLRAESVRNATVSATVVLVDRFELFMILRNSLIAIAAAAMLASLALVVDILGATSERESAPSKMETDGRTKGARAQEAKTAGREERIGPEEEVFDIDIPDLSADVKAEIIEQSEEYAKNVPGGTEGIEPAATVDAVDLEAGEPPSGLYSPRSDIGWEAYAADRLASELHRCASFEQDLVLLMMEPKADGADWATIFPDFAESTVSFFTFRDLVFERGKRGVSVILPNVDLEHGLRMADEFRHKLRKGPEEPLAAADIRVGLTARSGRLVDAERLMLEASRALTKAIEEEASPVVAFKPDPERYRSFIAARS
jgi:hypothetical protein